MFKPSEEKSQKTHEMINSVLQARLEDPQAYTALYCYGMLEIPGLAKRMSSYAVGFSPEQDEFVVIEVDEAGNSGEMVFLNKSNVASVKKGMQGNYKIKTNDKRKVNLYVVPYTSTMTESAYILPIVQEKEAYAFVDFLKRF